MCFFFFLHFTDKVGLTLNPVAQNYSNICSSAISGIAKKVGNFSYCEYEKVVNSFNVRSGLGGFMLHSHWPLHCAFMSM